MYTDDLKRCNIDDVDANRNRFARKQLHVISCLDSMAEENLLHAWYILNAANEMSSSIEKCSRH